MKIKTLPLTILLLSNLLAPEAFSQPSAMKEVWVLFPMARDAQKVTVSFDSQKRMIYQGDIVIAPSQVVTDPAGTGTRKVDLVMKMRRMLYKQHAQGKQPNLFSAGTATWAVGWGRWPDGVIPYKVHPDMPQSYRDLIAEVIAHINSKTNLCIRKREAGENDYVEYAPVEDEPYHGSSPLGKVGGKQQILLDITDASLKTVVHESLHAAGFIHEQSRSDRDEFIEVLTENIRPGMEHNFDKDLFSENYTRYDFRSVMHYSRTNMGIDGRITMRPLDDDNEIAPSSRLTELDIEGVNTAYPNSARCDERKRKITIMDFNPDGSLGEDLSVETVSNGWCDAEPIFTNGAVSHMMLLNNRSDFARVRPIGRDGTLGDVDDAVYEKEWASGWEDLETFYDDNTTYILHQKRWEPVYTGTWVIPFEDEQGFTRITKVRRDRPFEGNTLGDLMYEDTWGYGWTVIKFFYVGERAFIFRYRNTDGRAHVYEIDRQNPFANNSLGARVYNSDWRTGWNVVRFFFMNNRTYCFLVNSGTGRVMIHEMNQDGSFGDVKYETAWEPGWDNLNVITINGRTYFITLKSSTGRMHYSRFRRGDPFAAQTPYEIIDRATWSKGWTHTKIYSSPDGYKLLLMKK